MNRVRKCPSAPLVGEIPFIDGNCEEIMMKFYNQRNFLSFIAIIAALTMLSGCLPGWNLPDSDKEPVEEKVEQAITEEEIQPVQTDQNLYPPDWITGSWNDTTEQGLSFEFRATTIIFESIGRSIDFVQIFADASATFTEKISENYYAIIARFPDETAPKVLEFDKLSETSIQFTDQSSYFNLPISSLEFSRAQEISNAPIENPIESSCLSWQVNINTAPKDEIAQIIYINNELADLIIAGRPFEAVEDLIRVEGIDDSKLTGILGQRRACV
jgi:hypothetical protein